MLKMIDLFPIWDKLLKKKLDNDTNRKKTLVKYQTREKNLYFCRPVYDRPGPRNKSPGKSLGISLSPNGQK